ncbi:unnamed protein product [Closterium sp. Yama58-4]|nr:unnamed protein product [Closterium sp. Yama58-4]
MLGQDCPPLYGLCSQGMCNNSAGIFGKYVVPYVNCSITYPTSPNKPFCGGGAVKPITCCNKCANLTAGSVSTSFSCAFWMHVATGPSGSCSDSLCGKCILFPSGTIPSCNGTLQCARLVSDSATDSSVTAKLSHPFHKDFRVTWGNVTVSDDGRAELSLDKASGSGWSSNQPYYNGWFSSWIKVPSGYTPGVVTAFYLHSEWNASWPGDFHDEVDMEFLGERFSSDVILQTNWYGQGVGGHEERLKLWFDPAADYHHYAFQVNPDCIRWFVDGILIREACKTAVGNDPFPSSSMFLVASLWDGSSWATQYGALKIDWAHAPFRAGFHGLSVDGCYWRQMDEKEAPACARTRGNRDWQPTWEKGLEEKDYVLLRHTQAHYMTYSYALDKTRKPFKPKRTAEATVVDATAGEGVIPEEISFLLAPRHRRPRALLYPIPARLVGSAKEGSLGERQTGFCSSEFAEARAAVTSRSAMGGRKARHRMHVGALAALAAACFALAAVTSIPGVARHLSLLSAHRPRSSPSAPLSAFPLASSAAPRHLLLERADTIVSGEQGAGVRREGGAAEPRAHEEEERCEEPYGWLPCSTTVGGNAFLMVAYGYIILVAARLISDGSELLLQVLDPGLIGGLFLPMLGAMPDTVLILVSGLGGSREQAQEEVLVGMGVLAGSTVMILTVAWGGSLLCGRCDLEEKERSDGSVDLVAKDKTLTRPWDLKGTGVTTDEQTRLGAWIMMATVIPFVIMQVPFLDGGQYPEYQARITALLGLLLSTAGLVAYCAYQVLSPWLQSSKIHYARMHLMRARALHHLHDLALQNTWGGLLLPDGTPNRETIHRVFRHFDEDGNGTLSRSELKGLVLGLGIRSQAPGDVPADDEVAAWMRDFDSNSDGEIGYEEFMSGMQRWITHHSSPSHRPSTMSLLRGASADNKFWEGQLASAKGQLEGLEQELEEEVEDEEQEDVVKTPAQIYREAIMLIAGGAMLVGCFADPVIDSITAFSRASSIPPFFVAFVVTPLASNASELVSSLYFAMKKRRRTASLTYSQVYGAITMNNTMCLGTFLALIYFRGLAWQFSSEVVIILLNTFVVGLLGGSRHTFPTWMAFPVLLLYPVSLAIVACLDTDLGIFDATTLDLPPELRLHVSRSTLRATVSPLQVLSVTMATAPVSSAMKASLSTSKAFLASPVVSGPASANIARFDGLKSASTFAGAKPTSQAVQLRAKSSAVQSSSAQSGVVRCEQTEPGMKLVFVSAEVAPWSKTGGLGDVLGGLPPALAARGHRVMTVSPRYDQYKDAWDTDVIIDVKVGDAVEKVRFFHCYKRGVDRVFVDHPLFLAKVYGKTGSKVYGPKTGVDYDDNVLRFSLFNQAALMAPKVLALNNNPFYSGTYGEDVVFVANDWHTGVLPAYLKVLQQQGHFRQAKVAFCTHNIAYQGRFAPSDFDRLNLPDSFRPSFAFTDGYATPVKGPKINWLKAGFTEADMVLTVSPNYAAELQSGPAKGVELDDVIRAKGIKGIVNGMDVTEWDPSEDKFLDARYDASNVLEVKPALKEALQAEVGLPVRADVPVLAFIGRLEEQKGSDILSAAVEEILAGDVQLIVLGTGKKYLEQQLEALETKYPDKARGVVKFNTPLAHLMTAGADFMLVPSRFEPCGLIQLHAMRYGTVPIVASTGGLVDTVKDGVTGFQIGEFNVDCEAVYPEDVATLTAGVQRALKVFGTPAFDQMILNGMAQDLSWKGPAKEWEETLLSLQVENSSPGQADGVEIAPKALANVAAP